MASTMASTGAGAGGAGGMAAALSALSAAGGGGGAGGAGGAGGGGGGLAEAMSALGGAAGGGGGAAGGGGMGGIPCGEELPMEFFVEFLFTFIIYFCVFGFVPYEHIVSIVTKYVFGIPKKIYAKMSGMMPSFIKKNASKLYPSFVSTYFKKTLPAMIQKEKERMLTPLQVKLQKLKDTENTKLQNKNAANGSGSFMSKMNTRYSNTKVKILSFWEIFRDKLIPGIFISLIYYSIWFIIFKLLAPMLKYFINMAMQH